MNSITVANLARPVAGLEGFCEATEEGQIFSIERETNRADGSKYRVKRRLLSQKTTAAGYKSISFWIAGKRKMFLVHRLVMLAFTAADKGRPLVNHINGVRGDNRLGNLEWCTKSENSIHAFRVLKSRHSQTGKLGALHQRSLRIRGVNVKTGESAEFAALMDAQRSGYLASCISECLHGTQKTHRGMRWEQITQGV